MATSGTAIPPVTIDRRRLTFSNVGKVLYPAAGFTKGDVIDYYLNVAPAIVPHLSGRALTLKRFPDGVGEGSISFFEKNCPSHRPPWVKTADIPGKTGATRHCVVGDRAALLWAANLAALELHTSLARAKAPGRPTMLAVDLDPGAPAGIADCARLALVMRDLLERLGLRSFPKTSGGKGLHVYVPLNTPSATFDGTKDFARALASLMERQEPGRVTANMSKQQRGGKVFIDWSQNDTHKTTVCAYSLRARERPTVSTPVAWREVEAAARGKSVLSFEAAAVLKRVAQHGDLFEPVLKLKQRLPEA